MELEDLVMKAKNGDSTAHEEIFNRFKGYIYKTCIGIYISGYDMNDLIQLGNITLIKAIKKFDPLKNKSFTPYATSAIRNNYFYEIRQKSKFNAECSINQETEEGLEFIENIASSCNIEEDLLHKEKLAQLSTALSKLQPNERELIEYVYLKEGKLIDYAKIRNMKYATCFKHKDRILKKLRRMLST